MSHYNIETQYQVLLKDLKLISGQVVSKKRIATTGVPTKAKMNPFPHPLIGCKKLQQIHL
jgi:hypothetical protein